MNSLKRECGEWRDEKAQHFLSMARSWIRDMRIKKRVGKKCYQDEHHRIVMYLRLYQKRLEFLHKTVQEDCTDNV